ncbi:MAG: DUF4292 domain-containing protein [Saprospiraceae bacterium]|nr:DUF4292 domain-containing protein [Saprospiraceae bacterium]MDW8482928.1 DUF4292 domain-containing protein [Saprospiraceae bacterium]
MPKEERITPATQVLPADILVKRLQESSSARLRTIAASARLSIEGDNLAAEASASLIWIRDSALWVSVKKYGVEVLRVLFTRDSLLLLNRLEKTFVAIGQADLYKHYALLEGLPLVQGLLLAEAWLPDGIDLQASTQDSLHRLSGTNGLFGIDYRIEEGSFWLRYSSFFQPAEGRWLKQMYTHFRQLPRTKVFFPHFRRLEVLSPESGYLRAEIDFTQVEVNVDKTFRFDIPEHYQRLSWH